MFAIRLPTTEFLPNSLQNFRIPSLIPVLSELEEHFGTYRRRGIKPTTIHTLSFNGTKPSISKNSLLKRLLTGTPFAGTPKLMPYWLVSSWHVISKANH